MTSDKIYQEFTSLCRAEDSHPGRQRALCKTYWKSVFNTKMPIQPIPLLILAIQYELVYRSYTEEGKDVPIKIAKRHHCAIRFKPEELDKNMRILIELQLKYNKERKDL